MTLIEVLIVILERPFLALGRNLKMGVVSSAREDSSGMTCERL
jgi:hypothetical protein